MALLVVGLSLLATAQFARHRGDRTRDQPPTRTAHRDGSGGARIARAAGRTPTGCGTQSTRDGSGRGCHVRRNGIRGGDDARFHRFEVRGGRLACPGSVRFDAYHSPLQSTPAWAKPNHGFFHCQHLATCKRAAVVMATAKAKQQRRCVSCRAPRARPGQRAGRLLQYRCFKGVSCIATHERGARAQCRRTLRAHRRIAAARAPAWLRLQSSTRADFAAHKSDCAETARTPGTRMPALGRHSSALPGIARSAFAVPATRPTATRSRPGRASRRRDRGRRPGPRTAIPRRRRPR